MTVEIKFNGKKVRANDLAKVITKQINKDVEDIAKKEMKKIERKERNKITERNKMTERNKI